MLDEKDLRSIEGLMDEKIRASEGRMVAQMDERIRASEDRMVAQMDEKIRASEDRMVKRIDDTESRLLALMENQQAELARMNLILENQVLPSLRTLAEGQKTIRETMAPLSRVEALEDEVAFLKQMLRTLANEVNEMKKAQ